MFGDITQANQIYIACGYTDMRKSIDGLVMRKRQMGKEKAATEINL